MWQTDCEAPTANVRKRGDSLMKCEYKVERISDDLEKYLNEKGSQGWRCASVTTATGLGWTHIVVLERDEEEQPVDTVSKIVEFKSEVNNEKLNEEVMHNPNLEEPVTEQKARSALEKIAEFYVAFEFAWFILNIVVPFFKDIRIGSIKWIILFIMIIVDLILIFILNKQNRKSGMKNDEI